MLRHILTAALLLTVGAVRAQITAEQVVEDMAAEIAEEDGLTEEIQEGLAEMMVISERKLDLNRASDEELAKLLFLNKHQIYSFLKHRRLVGHIELADELRTVSGFDDLTVDKLMCFAMIGDSVLTRRRALPSNANSIVRVWGSVPKAKGFHGEMPKFNGGPLGTLLRTEVEGGRVWKAGLTMKNEPGEPMFSEGTTLTDYVGGYALYTNQYGTIKKVVCGNYNVNLGQGLGMWTGYNLDALSSEVTADRRANGVGKTMSATAEMRGVAGEVRIGKVGVTGYFSDSDQDGTIRKRDDGTEYVLTTTAGGQHRTDGERKKRNAVEVMTAGGYVRYATDGLAVGVGANWRETSVGLWHGNQEYRKKYPTGREMTTAHLDAKAYMARTAVYGEVAYQGKDAWAGIVGIDRRVRRTGGMVTCVVRRYGERYYPMQQSPMSRVSSCGGESGVYLAGTLSAWRRTEMIGSVDLYKERNVQNGKWTPDKGLLLRARGDIRLGHRSTLTIGVRHSHRRMIEQDSVRGRREYEALTRPKVTWTMGVGRRLTLSTMCEASRYAGLGKEARGVVGSQSIKWKTDGDVVSVTAMADVFGTEDYAARVYSRQPNVLYDMSFPTRSGRGMTAAMMVKVMPISALRIWLHATHTRYFDRESIGSGNDMTEGPGKSMLKVQVQWKWHR